MTYSYTGEGINPLIEIFNETGLNSVELVNFTEVGNFEASGLVSTEQVADYLRETLPPTHLEGCPSICYNSNACEGFPSALGTFDTRNHEINVWGPIEQFQGKEDIFNTVTHEVGHNVHANIMAERPDIAERWSQLNNQSWNNYRQDGTGFVSDYARTNVYEDFAETYAAFVRDPEKLQFYCPEKYEFMKQVVFAGHEYSPTILGYLDYDSLGRQVEVTGNGTWVVATGEKIA